MKSERDDEGAGLDDEVTDATLAASSDVVAAIREQARQLRTSGGSHESDPVIDIREPDTAAVPADGRSELGDDDETTPPAGAASGAGSGTGSGGAASASAAGVDFAAEMDLTVPFVRPTPDAAAPFVAGITPVETPEDIIAAARAAAAAAASAELTEAGATAVTEEVLGASVAGVGVPGESGLVEPAELPAGGVSPAAGTPAVSDALAHGDTAGDVADAASEVASSSSGPASAGIEVPRVDESNMQAPDHVVMGTAVPPAVRVSRGVPPHAMGDEVSLVQGIAPPETEISYWQTRDTDERHRTFAAGLASTSSRFPFWMWIVLAVVVIVLVSVLISVALAS